MARLVVSLIGGISLGGTYALVALGIVLAFRATGTFNFAHGQLMLIPAFLVGAWQLNHTAPTGVAVVAGLGLAAVIGVAFYLFVLQKTTGMPHFMGVIATLGLAAVLDGIVTMVFGSPQYSIAFPGLPTGVVRILGANISSISLVLTAFTLVLAGLVAAGLRFTTIGTHIRAAGQDALLASQSGINVRWVFMGSWALAAVLAGVAGITFGTTNVVGTSMVDTALIAFPAILIGGLDSIEGAIVGGLLVGIFQGFVATYLGGQYLEVLTYVVLLAVLLLYPQGLFGTKQVTRV